MGQAPLLHKEIFMKFLLAKKIGMTTLYKEGVADNVTLLEAMKNVVIGERTAEKDGYEAVKIGVPKDFKDKKKEKKGDKKYSQISEVRLENADDKENFKEGEELKVNQFEAGEKVVIKAISKGKGFQGVVKRHGFAGSPASHGHRHDLRAPGSIGSAFPQKVIKGKKMAGRMGGENVTVKNLKVSEVYPDKNMIAIKGAVPGNAGKVVKIIAN